MIIYFETMRRDVIESGRKVKLNDIQPDAEASTVEQAGLRFAISKPKET